MVGFWIPQSPVGSSPHPVNLPKRKQTKIPSLARKKLPKKPSWYTSNELPDTVFVFPNLQPHNCWLPATTLLSARVQLFGTEYHILFSCPHRPLGDQCRLFLPFCYSAPFLALADELQTLPQQEQTNPTSVLPSQQQHPQTSFIDYSGYTACQSSGKFHRFFAL